MFRHKCTLHMSFKAFVVRACAIVCTVRRKGRIAFSVQWFGCGLQVRGIVVEFTAEDKSWSVQAVYGVHPMYWVRGLFHQSWRCPLANSSGGYVWVELSLHSPYVFMEYTEISLWYKNKWLCCSGVIYSILFILHVAWREVLWRWKSISESQSQYICIFDCCM